ncbi:MAG: hypothetical protein N2643_02825 [Endomicrobia bacterium]|nr:hypothetical protein [Endomicrobiia bacterium]
MKVGSFSAKLLKILIFSLTIFSVTLTIAIYNLVKNNLLLNLKNRSEFMIEELKTYVYPTIDLLNIKKLISEIKKNRDIFYFILYDENGNVIYNYINPLTKFKPNVLETADLQKNKLSLKIISKEKNNFIYSLIKRFNPILVKNNYILCAEITIPIFIKEKKFGIVQLGQDGKYLYSTLSNALTTIILISICILFITIIPTYFLLNKTANPINILSNVAEEISKGNLQVSVPIFHTSYEIHNLSLKMQHMVWGLRERETIKNIFGKYIDKKLVDKLLKEKIQLKGVKKEVVVFYIDMQEFTKFTEQTQPEVVVDTLNKFFTIAIDAITKYEGMIDKLIGDAVLALFGAIETKGNEAENALMAAIEFINALKSFNSSRKNYGLTEIKAGTTIHIGEVIVGNIGHLERMEFTVVGDAVNTASRMQLYNRQFNIPILLTKEFISKINNNKFNFRYVSTVSIRGKTQPIELYTLQEI